MTCWPVLYVGSAAAAEAKWPLRSRLLSHLAWNWNFGLLFKALLGHGHSQDHAVLGHDELFLRADVGPTGARRNQSLSWIRLAKSHFNLSQGQVWEKATTVKAVTAADWLGRKSWLHRKISSEDEIPWNGGMQLRTSTTNSPLPPPQSSFSPSQDFFFDRPKPIPAKVCYILVFESSDLNI